jgi:hypothetical protein
MLPTAACTILPVLIVPWTAARAEFALLPFELLPEPVQPAISTTANTIINRQKHSENLKLHENLAILNTGTLYNYSIALMYIKLNKNAIAQTRIYYTKGRSSGIEY